MSIKAGRMVGEQGLQEYLCKMLQKFDKCHVVKSGLMSQETELHEDKKTITHFVWGVTGGIYLFNKSSDFPYCKGSVVASPDQL